MTTRQLVLTTHLWMLLEGRRVTGGLEASASLLLRSQRFPPPANSTFPSAGGASEAPAHGSHEGLGTLAVEKKPESPRSGADSCGLYLILALYPLMLMSLGSLLDPAESQFPRVGSEASSERDICPRMQRLIQTASSVNSAQTHHSLTVKPVPSSQVPGFSLTLHLEYSPFLDS